MFVLVSLVVIAITILISWLLRKQKYMSDCLRKFPGPAQTFFIGNAADFFSGKDVLYLLKKYLSEYGDIVHFRIGPIRHYILYTDPELAGKIFPANNNLEKGDAYTYIQPWLKEGLITASEKTWKAQRRMLTPAFSGQLVNEFISVFNSQSNILVEKIKKLIPTDSLDINPLIHLVTLDIICETTMGVSLNAQINDENADYVHSVKEMCRLVVVRYMSLWKSIKALYIFSEDYRKERRALKILNDYTTWVIAERKKQRREIGKNAQTDKKKKQALLDLLLDYSETENRLTEEEIKQEVHTFMFAGHDTSTAALNFCIYSVAHNPEIQQSIYDEQKSILGDGFKGDVTSGDINEMKYLEAVIKESLRMYPPVPLTSRVLSEEIILDGKVIPKGTMMLFLVYGLHRNEKYFSNPEIFDPSRFETAQLPHTYLPFSSGPRNCIGQKFAMNEIKVILSKLFRNFIFSPAEPKHELDVQAEVVLLSKTGFKVKITERE